MATRKTEIEFSDRFTAVGERLHGLNCAFVSVYTRKDGVTDYKSQVSGYETGLAGLKRSMRREITRLEKEYDQ